MRKYVAALFSDLCKHSDAWNRIPGEQMTGLVGEYKALAEKVASDYGSVHSNFTGDGHLFLFENADAAVRFALKLVAAWHDAFAAVPALEGLQPIPLRVGAHFGEDTQIGDGEAWVGRANNMANRIQGLAKPDTVLVSESMLDLIDFARYEIESVATCKLEGDCVARRTLYQVVRFDEAASAAKPADELTAEEWFLRGVAMIGMAKEGSDQEEACYVEALRLRPDYASAHNNYAVLLEDRGDIEGAENGYLEALRLEPDYAVAHYNYAILLKRKGDLEGAEKHYLDALRSRPEYSSAHNNYAILLQTRGDVKRADVERAEEHYVEALRVRPDFPEAHSNYGALLQERGDMKAAERHYLQALRLRPDYAKAHNNYAALLKARGDSKGAEQHYLKALRLKPDYAQAHNNYAILLREQGHPRKAKRHFEQAFRLAPDNPAIKTAYETRAWRE